ncbi:hypothetical protein K443DRAFT_224753 [Laccaria amethystina LaAM-08-1]|uniref:Uncharacterized protein n=1 Tax=Laccaria amethystina LaAM-08-1 TaxID=1095629 RepID=A0A0C9WMA2_9AGAR|nr:hypothetical protein K443DRAFT_224753 [Laccaria amethystina LaAM-08-1]
MVIEYPFDYEFALTNRESTTTPRTAERHSLPSKYSFRSQEMEIYTLSWYQLHLRMVHRLPQRDIFQTSQGTRHRGEYKGLHHFCRSVPFRRCRIGGSLPFQRRRKVLMSLWMQTGGQGPGFPIHPQLSSESPSSN